MVVVQGQLICLWVKGKLCNFIVCFEVEGVFGKCGIGYICWVIYGKLEECNVYLYCSSNGVVVVVQNGIIENYCVLWEQLEVLGVVFQLEIDIEVIFYLLVVELQQL